MFCGEGKGGCAGVAQKNGPPVLHTPLLSAILRLIYCLVHLGALLLAVILVYLPLLRDGSSSRDFIRVVYDFLRRDATTGTILIASIMDARGITGILNIIHIHDTIDVSHPCDTDDILTRPTSSRPC